MEDQVQVLERNPTEAAMHVVEVWHEETVFDVQGSYTGMSNECEAPEQDADDL